MKLINRNSTDCQLFFILSVQEADNMREHFLFSKSPFFLGHPVYPNPSTKQSLYAMAWLLSPVFTILNYKDLIKILCNCYSRYCSIGIMQSILYTLSVSILFWLSNCLQQWLRGYAWLARYVASQGSSCSPIIIHQ